MVCKGGPLRAKMQSCCAVDTCYGESLVPLSEVRSLGVVLYASLSPPLPEPPLSPDAGQAADTYLDSRDLAKVITSILDYCSSLYMGLASFMSSKEYYAQLTNITW